MRVVAADFVVDDCDGDGGRDCGADVDDEENVLDPKQ